MESLSISLLCCWGDHFALGMTGLLEGVMAGDGRIFSLDMTDTGCWWVRTWRANWPNRQNDLKHPSTGHGCSFQEEEGTWSPNVTSSLNLITEHCCCCCCWWWSNECGVASILICLKIFPPPGDVCRLTMLLVLGCRFRTGSAWMRTWRVNSSDREKRFSQPGCKHWWGFSPVCVRIWRVWCSSRKKAFWHIGHW